LGLDVLMQRVLARQLPEFRDHMAFLTEAKFGINAGRDKLEPQFFEALGNRSAQRGRRDVLQWGSAP
jgi:hypothetical protein